jgi:hypothetical protein
MREISKQKSEESGLPEIARMAYTNKTTLLPAMQSKLSKIFIFI